VGLLLFVGGGVSLGGDWIYVIGDQSNQGFNYSDVLMGGGWLEGIFGSLQIGLPLSRSVI
jgi:hypothetical protein